MTDPRLTRRGALGLGAGAVAWWAAGRPAAAGLPPATARLAATAGTAAKPVPGDAWPTVDPEEAGWSPVLLREVRRFARDRRSTSLLVVDRGRLLVERYWGSPTAAGPEVARDVASVQKSVVAVLVGIAVAEGRLRRDQRVTSVLGRGWSNAAPADERRVRVRHLLSMTSGLDESLRRVAEPGTVWSYNTPAYQRLRPVLEAVTGRDIDALTRRRLWRPIGATGSSWGPRPGPGTNWALSTTARTLARFGLLVQRRGRWGDVQVVPKDQLERALSPSTDLNPSYGELWWLNGQAGWRRGDGGPLRPGPLLPDAPPDLVAALGAGGQRCFVSREARLVVVRQGEPPGRDFDEGLWRRLEAARST